MTISGCGRALGLRSSAQLLVGLERALGVHREPKHASRPLARRCCELAEPGSQRGPLRLHRADGVFSGVHCSTSSNHSSVGSGSAYARRNAASASSSRYVSSNARVSPATDDQSVRARSAALGRHVCAVCRTSRRSVTRARPWDRRRGRVVVSRRPKRYPAVGCVAIEVLKAEALAELRHLVGVQQHRFAALRRGEDGGALDRVAGLVVRRRVMSRMM